MAWIVREGSDIKPPMNEDQIIALKEQYPEEFKKLYKEI
jgi:hypothetical protein